MEGNGFAKLVAHAPYTLNPCSSTEKVREFAKIAMTEDLQKMEYLPGNYYNFHPGSHTGQGTEKGVIGQKVLMKTAIAIEFSTAMAVLSCF